MERLGRHRSQWALFELHAIFSTRYQSKIYNHAHTRGLYMNFVAFVDLLLLERSRLHPRPFRVSNFGFPPRVLYSFNSKSIKT
jgi:hypothetical protein